MTVIVTAMSGAGEAGDLLASVRESDRTFVFFYQAPWEAALARDGLADGWVDEWTRHHASLLEAWQAVPDRVVLVNVGRAGSVQRVVECLSDLGIELDPDRVPAPMREDFPSWARTLAAAHFAEAAPAAWECYEALESCAQVTGAEPELRGTSGLVDATGLAWLVARLREAGDDRAALQQAHDQLVTDLEHAVARMEAWEEGARELRRENDLLLGQIEQFNSELAQVEAARAKADASLRALREEAKARAAVPVDDEMPALRRENELLVLQLEQLHEELEQGMAQAGAATKVAERAAMLGERARLMLSRQALRRGST